MTQGLCVYLKPVKFRYLRMVLLLIPFRVHIYIYISKNPHPSYVWNITVVSMWYDVVLGWY